MPARHTRRRRAIAVATTALLCTLVSAPIGGGAAPSAEPAALSPPLPSVPTEAIEAPASLSRPGVVVTGGQGRFGGPTASAAAASSASVSGIPGAALSAYQRAETVINIADQSCNLPWQLIAAIGRVESGHGTANGNSLDDDGLATPGIYGIALNGTHNTQAISDTDAGQYDRDTRWDRAVGPMQFIPSTWSVVGVDGDNDGKRNPQDIDDA
ncbi:MAG: lytic transglycosylase domain-containing protein, partial [Nocardioides sp.]